jgi:glyoxylase-like metal-dependent hydrolase (beta-lactamase superfamily II)
MLKRLTVTALFLTLLSMGATAQDAKTILGNASKAMSADNLNAITYSGSASNVNFGQTKRLSGPYVLSTTITNYTRAISLTQPASLATGTTMTPAAPGAPPAQPGTFTQNITSANAGWTQQLEIWTTPWGFLKGAAANNATARSQRIGGKTFNVVSWMTPQKAPSGLSYTVTGYINDQNMVERVETWVEHPIFGNLLVESTYTEYRDFGGVKVPGKIVQRRAGWPTFEATITNASANPANIMELLTPPPPQQRGGAAPQGAPAAARGGAPAPPAVQSQKLAEGVYRITGGYVALAVEMKDHIVVLEGPQSEARGLAVIAEAKRVIPNKPIRYVVNTHAHFDHASGLAPFAAEGVIIITHESNVAFLEKALSGPRTLVGDALAKANRKPKFEGVGDRKVLRDDTHTIELHHVKNLEHTDGMLIAYLPREKILFTADFNVPAAGQPVSPAIATLVQNVDRLKLDFDTHVLVHAPNPDRPQTKADLLALAKGTR